MDFQVKHWLNFNSIFRARIPSWRLQLSSEMFHVTLVSRATSKSYCEAIQSQNLPNEDCCCCCYCCLCLKADARSRLCEFPSLPIQCLVGGSCRSFGSALNQSTTVLVLMKRNSISSLGSICPLMTLTMLLL